MQTISDKLAAAGWTSTDEHSVGSLVRERGIMKISPRAKSIGIPIALTELLPPGALVHVPGETFDGVVEHSPRGTGYVRLASHLDFDTPVDLLRQLIETGATVG